MKVLVTGGSGMVGQNILGHFRINEFEMLAPSSSKVNLFDYDSILNYLKEKQPDLIIHAAGRVGGIQANVREPVKFLLENLDMGRNIVWAARQAGIKKFINLGSSCMYPRFSDGLLKEEDVLKGELEPTNEGYALAKVVTARLCKYISQENVEFQYKTLIPCNLYGGWDKFNPAHSHLIPAIIAKIHQAMIDKQDEVVIWGDGLARREFMYAGDFADCIVKAIKEFDTLPMEMNVGLGYDYTINEYYQAVSDVLDYDGLFTHDLTKPAGMKQKLVDVSKQKYWGWKAKTDLHQGIKLTYEFFLNHICDTK